MRFSKGLIVDFTTVYTLNGSITSGHERVKYLGLHLDRKLKLEFSSENLAARMRKRARCIDPPFSYHDNAARICLYQSLVLSLFDYCSPVTWPSDKSSHDWLEGCIVKFVKTLRLKANHDDYEGRLREIGCPAYF